MAALLLVSSFAFAGGQAEEAGGEPEAAEIEEMTLNLGHGGTVEDLRQVASEEFKRVVEEETDGNVTIEIFPSSTLGNWREMQEGLQIGTVDFVIEDIGTLQRYSDMAAVGFMPYVYLSREHWERVWNSDVKDVLLDKFEEETGIMQLGSMYRGARNLTAVRPVRELEDVEGLKIRVPGAQAAIDGWKALGANPQAMAFPEVFGALQQGVIDAQENPFNVIWNDSIYEVAPYIVFTEHVYGAFNFEVWAETFESWPEEVQAAVLKAADAASEVYNSMQADNEQEIIDKLDENPDVTLIRLSAEQKQRWADAVRPVQDEYPELQEFLQAVRDVQP
jgi:tripartite ATP-independent transporter DctP family solute receptor